MAYGTASAYAENSGEIGYHNVSAWCTAEYTTVAFEIYQPDIVIYDVLGDVVCGGFAKPVDSHFSVRDN